MTIHEELDPENDIDACTRPSLCDGDTTNNQWFEGNVCLLDSLSSDQVIYSIQRNPVARVDLKRVTTCPELLELLDRVPLLPTTEESDLEQRRFNQGDSLPFYNLFRGNLSH